MTVRGKILTAVGLVLLFCVSLLFFSRNSSKNDKPPRETAGVSTADTEQLLT